MKKTYIAPSTESFQMKVNGILMGSKDYFHNDKQADTGSSGNGVNFGREFNFTED